jgi:hypothetical protein
MVNYSSGVILAMGLKLFELRIVDYIDSQWLINNYRNGFSG